MDRRAALRLLAATPLVAAFPWAPEAVRVAAARVAAARERAAPGAPTFFTPHEWATVRLLADLIIPRDARSGSATDAGVPEFMDFMCADDSELAAPLRGGLAWLDRECDDRFGATFVAASVAQRAALLDDIAWPARARPAHAAGVAFFNSFRDLTASGFFSSKIGVQDLRYVGNTLVAEWRGCPPEVLAKLGVSYDLLTPRRD
jgi:gluconate 2-dehydrogenase subunit 3-like protein